MQFWVLFVHVLPKNAFVRVHVEGYSVGCYLQTHCWLNPSHQTFKERQHKFKHFRSALLL